MLRLVFSIISFFLVLGFILAVFAGGGLESQPWYPTVEPLLSFVLQVAHWLSTPVVALWNWLELPSNRWLPVTPAAPVFETIGLGLAEIPGLKDWEPWQRLETFPYGRVFTGGFQWPFVLMQALVNGIESLVSSWKRKRTRQTKSWQSKQNLPNNVVAHPKMKEPVK